MRSSADLTGQLVCYARSVINIEWEKMEAGTLGEHISPWGAAMFRTLEDVELEHGPTGECLRPMARADVGS